MKKQDFTRVYLIDQTPEEIFKSLIDVRGWWSGLFSEEIEGHSDKLNEEFSFRAGDGIHYSKHKLVELTPNKKAVWLVTDSSLSFLEDKGEWIGTKLCFEISKQGARTAVRFTHQGLVPGIECFDRCTSAWSQYLDKFLLPLAKKSEESNLQNDTAPSHL